MRLNSTANSAVYRIPILSIKHGKIITTPFVSPRALKSAFLTKKKGCLTLDFFHRPIFVHTFEDFEDKYRDNQRDFRKVIFCCTSD